MMGIFKRSLNNSATAVAPGSTVPARPIIQPGNTTVHHHGPNWFLIILGVPVATAITLGVFWVALWFLFWQLGSQTPEQDAAALVIYGGLAVAFLLLVSWRAGPFFDSWLAYKTEVQKELTRREEVKLLAAQTTLEPGRMNEADFQFARVILAVMMIAYDWLAAHNNIPFPGRWRPWSMRSAKETANGIGIKLTDAQANGISLWLHDKGVIDSPSGGQVTKTYPDLTNVRLLLEKEYGKPIQVVSPALRDNQGYDHIKNAN
jgi:hypothetical protein